MPEEVSEVALKVPYKERELAKYYGARWDTTWKTWFIPADASVEERETLLELYLTDSILTRKMQTKGKCMC